ncbi:U3 small nucleolar RNA-associated protein 25 homolog isoform X2 [Eubalaena glacialis]|uniref:U3 small nucleolar RNA-associated protein 25 homolog isoform X2 n=1 Tax=Eubalaena glacialis TaxID=27606 RepID=UPI002A5999FE|nr:U3 small nucleolar RNA-associated protein 25 homolog isoform X2 [Eubalaena glacialis]
MGKRRSRSQSQLLNSLTKKQKKHLRDFGEEHPFYDRVSRKEAKPQTCQLSESLDTSSSESEAESEPEQVSGYSRLLATLKDVSKEDEEEEEEEDSVIDETEMNLEDGDSDISVEEETAVESTDMQKKRTALKNGEEIRHVYCLHVINHVLKANAQVLANNSRCRSQKLGVGDDDDFRDQGLTRPKVLIVVPFREAALRVVQLFISLLEGDSKKKIIVSNKKRFNGEYGSDPEERPPNLKRPEDYEAVFVGNIDDHFRTGVAILQRSIRLYAPFYSSDILIASPLGLRTIIGGEGEKKRDFDFLSSIELLIIDQADIYLMQNWEHVLHLMNHMNLLPLDSHGVDFSRVRMWSLNNWSKYYRQTLLFGALQDAQINSVFNKYCVNVQGQVAVRNVPMTGSISHVLVQLPHVFQRMEAENLASVIEARFNFFVNKILPQYRDAVMSHTLIYVPSYFDFVRLRNYFKKEELNFTHICEYTQKSGVSRARHFFLQGEKQFLLLTERFHFYKRYTIKGIRNLIFYELPTYPHFYSEVCNMLQATTRGEEAAWTCTVLYSKYDAQRLAAVVGVERAAQMLQSKKNVHLFITGER